ncbi:MAG TPA: hypothetical protein VFR97_10900 [Capillimicrobium sp.]|nr:hypothetical protein [Capillimicrobium sp.]
MGEERLNASGFEFYEGIRIAIPGALVIALYVAVSGTFGLGAPSPDPVVAIVLAVAAGLFLYFVDASGRSQLYAAAQPHRVLERWNEEPPHGLRMQNAYFVVLDTVMPAGIRNRALYFGSIFRIGFEVIYLTAVPALTVLAISLVAQPADASRTTDTTALWWLVPCECLAMLVGLREGYLMARRGRDGACATWREVLSRMPEQYGGLGGAAVLIAVLASLAYVVLRQEPLLLVIAVASLGLLWSIRYLVGYRKAGTSQRRNIDVVTGTVMLSSALIVATVLAALELPASSVMSTAAAVSWCGAGIVAQLLLGTRGHEKKLWAAFHTQRAWLELNRELVARSCALTPKPAAADGAATTEQAAAPATS